MARTSKSRGKTPFSMRSNNKTSFKEMGSSPVRSSDPYQPRPGTNRVDMSLPEYREYGQDILDRIGPQGTPTVSYDPKEFNKLITSAERQKDDLRKRWGWSTDNENSGNSDNVNSEDFWSQYSF